MAGWTTGDARHSQPETRSKVTVLALASLAGCNSILGIGDLHASQHDDASIADATTIDAADANPADGGTPDAMRSWSVPALLQSVNTPAREAFPAPTDNDLELYFSRLSTSAPYGEIYVATRASTSVPFGAPVAVSAVNGATTNEIFAVPSHSGLELYVSKAGALTRSTRPNAASAWSAPVATTLNATYVSFSSDDLTAYVVSRCPNNVFQGNGPCLFTATRASTSSTTWTTPVYQPWADDVQFNSAAIADDGLNMLASGPISGSGTPVIVESRASTADPWANIQTIGPLEIESTADEARWNVDRTEVYVVEHPNATGGNYDIYISVLQ